HASIERDTAAIEPFVIDGAVRGVIAERNGRRETIEARALVLADGGFQGNADLMRRYVTPHPEKLLQRGAGSGQGVGLTMAASLGAELVGLDSFYGHLLGREALTNDQLWPYPTVDAVAQASIVIGADGRRIADEGMGGVYLANQVAKLSDPLSTSVIFDEQTWQELAADNRYPPCLNPAFVDVGGTVLSAPTIAALAEQLSVDTGALGETVDTYNAAMEAGTLASLTPARTEPGSQARAIRVPPFHAIELCAGITYTMGGIRVDPQGRVRHQDRRIIEGLYATGSCVGGFEGGAQAAYLGGLAKAVITALRAAHAIAHDQGRT
nr:FAD-binding protein [Gammaproteobacteria bacterium]